MIELIKADLGQIDMVVYSLASPVRKLPDSGEVIRSALKPIGESYRSTAVDTNKDTIIEASVEPATEQEIKDTVTVMGGQDWELWARCPRQGRRAGRWLQDGSLQLYRYRADLAYLLAWRSG